MSEHKINIESPADSLNGHSIFGPSSSYIYLNCPGGFIPHLYGRDNAGEDAAYGTVAHSVAETWLRSGKKPVHLVGMSEIVEEENESFEIVIDDEMLDYLEEYVSWVEYEPGEHYVETHIDISDITPIPNQGGTADHAVCQPGKLKLTDLKMGRGFQVFAFENTQVLLYAYGFFREWDWYYGFKEITIQIAQPRLGHFDSWTVSREYLIEFAQGAKVKMAEAWKPGGKRVPGEKQCKFCRVKSSCASAAALSVGMMTGRISAGRTPTEPEIKKLRKQLAEGEFEMKIDDIATMTTEEMCALLKYQAMSESFWKSLRHEVEIRAKEGEPTPGFKLARGNSRRFFPDPEHAADILEIYGVPKKRIYITKIASPNQALEALREKRVSKSEAEFLINSMAIKPLGKTVLVHDFDKREALGDPDAGVFEAESDADSNQSE